MRNPKLNAVTIETVSWYNSNLETRWNFLPVLMIMLSLVQVLMLSELSVAREREQGTFDQLLVTPLSPLQILIGKAVAPVVIGIFQATLVLLICQFWFKIPFAGDFFSLYLTFFAVLDVVCIHFNLRRNWAFNFGNFADNATGYGLLFRFVNADGFIVGNGNAG